MPNIFSNEDDLPVDKPRSSTEPLLSTSYLKLKGSQDADNKEYKSVLPKQEVPPGLDSYLKKTNMSQTLIGMVLINANIKNLRTVLDTAASQPYFYINIISISFSIVLQVLVGVALILNIRNNRSGLTNIYNSYKMDYTILVCVFMSTVANLFTASFTVNIPVESITTSS